MPPPPLSRPTRHHIFYGRSAKGGLRFDGAAAMSERITSAHQQAEDWINAQTGVEIVSLSNGSNAFAGDNCVFLTVWYRESPEN